MKGPRMAGAIAGPIARKALGGRGGYGALAPLAAAWADVVGPTLAGQCRPERVSFPRGRRDEGTLTLTVDPLAALEIQHETGLILDKVNRFMGHRAIARIKLVHGRVTTAVRNRPPPPEPPLAAAEEAEIADLVAAVPDGGLRHRLAELGRHLYARDRQRTSK